jgi:uncharacterized protein (DUF983 family)
MKGVQLMTSSARVDAIETFDRPWLRDLPDRGRQRLFTLLRRACALACPLCGYRSIFQRWLSLRDCCPRCGYQFEREDGYFLGADTINLVLAVLVALAAMIVLLVATSLGVVSLLAIMLPVTAGLPVLFFPFSRTFWMAIDLQIDPDGAGEGL